MNHRALTVIVFLAALSSCGKAPSGGGSEPIAVQRFAPEGGKADTSVPTAAAPQIAYTYDYGFRLNPDAVVTVQEAHLRLCDQLGPLRCQVSQMERSAGEGDHVRGSLTLLVAAPIARRFGDQLIAAAAKAGGEAVERQITAEDLSKQIVDVDARIRTKETLVNRLTTLLETRSGNIAQAVEAERAVNGAQEELEQARAEIAAMRGRVALSTIKVEYDSSRRLGGGFLRPVRSSLSAMGSLFGQSISVLVTLIAVLLPWALLGGLIWWIVRHIHARRRLAVAQTEADSGATE